jgi:hypothetical protein
MLDNLSKRATVLVFLGIVGGMVGFFFLVTSLAAVA